MRRRQTPSDEKLRLLQECDHWRSWASLDDERQCALCERKFTGHEVHLAEGHGGHIVAQCPTKGCISKPREWMYPGDPLTDDVVWQDWLTILDDLSEKEAAPATASPPPRKQRRSAGSSAR